MILNFEENRRMVFERWEKEEKLEGTCLSKRPSYGRRTQSKKERIAAAKEKRFEMNGSFGNLRGRRRGPK